MSLSKDIERAGGSQWGHATTRAMAFDVGEALGLEFLDGRVQSVHVAYNAALANYSACEGGTFASSNAPA
jgi:hypothetical protein